MHIIIFVNDYIIGDHISSKSITDSIKMRNKSGRIQFGTRNQLNLHLRSVLMVVSFNVSCGIPNRTKTAKSFCENIRRARTCQSIETQFNLICISFYSSQRKARWSRCRSEIQQKMIYVYRSNRQNFQHPFHPSNFSYFDGDHR